MMLRAIFVLTAAIAVWSSFAEPMMKTHHGVQLIVMATSASLLVASIIVSRKPRVGYVTALCGGLVLLAVLVRQQLLLQHATNVSVFTPWNPWIAFNLPDDPDGETFAATLKIAAVGLVVLATGCSALRLVPNRWTLRKSPLCERTWPAFVISLLVLSLWFLGSVRPYRIPRLNLVEKVQPKLILLHVAKRGMQFHETEIVQWSPGVLSKTENDRRLFQYLFQEQTARGVIPASISTRVDGLAESAHLENLQTQPAKPLRDWNAEGWYVLTGGNKILAFTTEYGISPPRELAEIFQTLDAIPTTSTSTGYTKDVCFGFCYDPQAGLGLRFINERCRYAGRKVACR